MNSVTKVFHICDLVVFIFRNFFETPIGHFSWYIVILSKSKSPKQSQKLKYFI